MMDFTTKGKLIAGCNWLMAGAGIITSIYVFALIFSVPPDIEPTLSVALAGAETQPPPASVAPAPKITATVPQPVQPSARAGAQLAARPGIQIPAREPQKGAVDSSEAPHAKHPGTPQPALNPATIPPGLGKDF
jgi:hypothetical protein